MGILSADSRPEQYGPNTHGLRVCGDFRDIGRRIDFGRNFDRLPFTPSSGRRLRSLRELVKAMSNLQKLVMAGEQRSKFAKVARSIYS